MKRIIIFCLLGLSLMSSTAQVPNDTGSLRTMINTVLVPNGQKSVTARQMNEIFNGILNLMKSNALDSAYKSGDTMYLTRRGGYPTIKVYVPGSGSISESDPTVPTAAKTLTTVDKTRWDNKQDKLTASSGTIAIEANVISAKNLSPVWNANKIMGRLITDAAPVTGQVLKWNGSEWAPAIDNNSGAAGSLASFDLAQFDTLGGTVKIKDSILEDTRLELLGNEDMVIAYDQGAAKGKYIKAYLKGVLELLYTQDTLGVKIVRSFHEGYNTGGFSVRYVPGGTPDYITSWPSKVYTGIWKRIDYNGEMVIEQMGALGSKNAGVTAATLGYTSQNLADLYGSYFAKSTSDRIDMIAMNQMIKSIGVGYFNHSLSPTRYYMNAKLVEFPYFTNNLYQVIKITGNNSWILNEGTRRTMFWRHPTTFDSANILVQSRYIISGITFWMADSAIAIHPSYQSEINNCKFLQSNYGVVLRWDMHASINHCGFENIDSAGVWVGRFEGITTGLDPQSNYFYMRDNKFTSSANTKYNIYIFRSNGATIEHTIFEGSAPNYNIYVDFMGGNNREMRIYSTHLENVPDSAHFYVRGINSSFYFDKIYAQTNAVLVDAGNLSGSEIDGTATNVYFNNIPYWGGVPSFKTSGAKWTFTNCAFIDLKNSNNWKGGVKPAFYSGRFATGIYKYLGNPVTIPDQLESFSKKYYDGESIYNGILQVPRYTDSTIETASPGVVFYHNDRVKYYGSFGTSYRPFIDSVTYYAPVATATANSQILTLQNFAGAFTTGAFTGLTTRFVNYQASVSAGILDWRLMNTSSTAGSTARLQLTSNTTGTGSGTLSIYNNGDIQQAASNADLTLWSNGSGRSILFKTNGGATKGTFNATGFRIGDATAPTVAFEIGSTGAILLPKGTTAQRPTGVTGYSRYNTDSVNLEYFDGGWKQVASREWIKSQGYSTSGGGGTSSESFFQPVDADYTIPTGTGNYHVIYFEPLTAARTVTIPTETGRVFTIRHGGSGAFNINLSVNIYENSSTWVSSIGQGQSITFYYDGTRHVKIK